MNLRAHSGGIDHYFRAIPGKPVQDDPAGKRYFVRCECGAEKTFTASGNSWTDLTIGSKASIFTAEDTYVLDPEDEE